MTLCRLPGSRAAAALLFLVACSSEAAEVTALPVTEASAHAGELFPRALYAQPAGCTFPAGQEMVLDEFRQRWFSSHLNAAYEVPLVDLWKDGGEGATLLRFIWLPTFHNPVIVRLTGSAEKGGQLVAIRLSGAGGYDPGIVADKVQRSLTAGEWRRIADRLAQSNVLEQPPALCDLGLDGSEWIFEAIDAHGYHFVRRWSPEDGPVRDVGLALLELTGWDLKGIY